ncbi:MAG: DUF177 domain-containing protein [Clostridia bacterium]|nr:DUF177 domain-containing protein [Clostridia bacterium]
MNIELRRFFEDDGTLDIDYQFTSEDELFASPVTVKGRIKSANSIVALNADVECSVSVQCAKCAKDIVKKLSVPMEHLLVSQLNDEDNDDFILVENMVLNLDELVLEDVYLSLPARFLCKDACKGLCPYCGTDLNEGTCNCKKPVDPRLAALQQLLDSNE